MMTTKTSTSRGVNTAWGMSDCAARPQTPSRGAAGETPTMGLERDAGAGWGRGVQVHEKKGSAGHPLRRTR